MDINRVVAAAAFILGAGVGLASAADAKPHVIAGNAFLVNPTGRSKVMAWWAYKNPDGTYRGSSSVVTLDVGTKVKLVRARIGGSSLKHSPRINEKRLLFTLSGENDEAAFIIDRNCVSKRQPLPGARRIGRRNPHANGYDANYTDRMNREVLDNYGKPNPNFTR